MKEELAEALYRDFPTLYRSHRYWGFAFGDGWEPLIRKLSKRLELIIGGMPDDEYRPAVSQTKEKFGELRFYMSSETDEMTEAIQEAELESCRTCEYCGQPGKKRNGGWIRTLCDTCAVPSPSESGEK